MADQKITDLGTASALTGTELVETVQGGVNVKTTTQDIADLGGGGGAVSSVNGQTGAVVLAAVDIANTPAGGIAATTVQAAVNELDSDIDSRIAAAIAGFKWKTSVRVATTVAGTLASSFENGDTVDGVVLATGNRILIKNQADQTTNGIYTVNASGAPTRATDGDSATELEGAAMTVAEGTTNANTTWLQTTDNITLGVSNIVFTQLGTSVPDADATTKGIARLYPSTSLGTNVDGAPDQNAVKVYVDAKVVDAINDSATTTAPSQNAVFDALALKAPLASPTFTGTPSFPTGTTAVTQSPADNSTKIATTAYTDAGLALKANLASPTFTGTPTLPTGTIATTQSAGNNTTAVATTAFVTAAAAAITKVMQFAVTDEVTNIGTGNAQITFRMPYAMTLTAVRASLNVAQASGTIFTVDINEAGTTILSTKLTIDNTAKTSVGAATPAVISDASLADDSIITVDVDQIGNGSAIGLKITLIGT